MSLSKWYADAVLPGKKATSFTRAAVFSSNFNWPNESVTEKITYFLSCDSSQPFDNPKIGKNSNVLINGYKQAISAEATKPDILFAVAQDQSLQSSSSSNSSESCSSSLSSSSLSFDPNSSSSSRSSPSYSSSSSTGPIPAPLYYWDFQQIESDKWVHNGTAIPTEDLWNAEDSAATPGGISGNYACLLSGTLPNGNMNGLVTIANPLQISFWRNSTFNYLYLSFPGTPNHDMFLVINLDDIVRLGGDPWGIGESTHSIPSPTGWQHLFFDWDGVSQLKLYVDGVLDWTTNYYFSLRTLDESVIANADELAIWNGTGTDGGVGDGSVMATELYNNGGGCFWNGSSWIYGIYSSSSSSSCSSSSYSSSSSIIPGSFQITQDYTGLNKFWYVPDGTYGGKTKYSGDTYVGTIRWEGTYWVCQYTYFNDDPSDPPPGDSGWYTIV